MLRLRATLVAMTAARPWRTGWSVERGVDFVLAAPALPAPVPAETDRRAAAEPPSFIDPDESPAPDERLGQTLKSRGTAVDPVGPACPFRAWSRLPARPSRA